MTAGREGDQHTRTSVCFSRPGVIDAHPELLLEVVDPPALAQRTADALRQFTGLPYVAVALREVPGRYVVRGRAGGRQRGGAGRSDARLGLAASAAGLAAGCARLTMRERLASVTAVPVRAGGDRVAVFFGGTHDAGPIDGQSLGRLEGAAEELADVMAAAARQQESLRGHLVAERQRIAEDLHDYVGPLLFAIGVAARQLAETCGASGVGEAGAEIETQARQATACLRAALRMLAAPAPEE